jgi:hypothetical protein
MHTFYKFLINPLVAEVVKNFQSTPESARYDVLPVVKNVKPMAQTCYRLFDVLGDR